MNNHDMPGTANPIARGRGRGHRTRVGGKVNPVTGAEITGTERDRMWQILNEQVFNYEAYQAKANRAIAVVALTPDARAGG